MKRWNKQQIILVSGVGAAVIATVGAGLAATGIGDDNEEPITGEALDKASDTALALLPGGRVTETEQGDEESFYEVEVTMPDGRQIDVQLDKDFKVVASEDDGAGEDDDD